MRMPPITLVAGAACGLMPSVCLAQGELFPSLEAAPSAAIQGVELQMPGDAQTIELSQHSRSARFTQDLDGDGKAENIAVMYRYDGHVLLQVEDGQGARKTLDLGSQIDINGIQETAMVWTTPASTTRVPLVVVEWAAGNYCGSGSWLAYVSVVNGEPRLALEHSGHSGDAPMSADTVARFNAGRRSVVLTDTVTDSEDPSYSSTTRTAYALRNGVFVKQGGS